jgi:hypothetical protein
MQTDSVIFFLGERFRWSLMGDDDGAENDEDSVINDLEYYLGNYEAKWDGATLQNALEYGGWERIKQVIWVRRNSAKVRESSIEAPGERNLSKLVFLPSETAEETAIWIVKAVMKPA